MTTDGNETFDIGAATAHLREVDSVVGELIDKHGPYTPRRSDDPYAQLLRAIMFQQLAGNAARAIMRRWMALYGDQERMPTPKEILETSDEQFRAAGVSRQKAGYFRDIARHVVEGKIDFSRMDEQSDAEVIEHLTAAKGVGVWTAHMFLMFQLGRPDVLPVGDLGVRNGMRIAYGLEAMPTPKQATEIGEKWRPYRSVGSWYMWRVVEVVPPVA
jgi:DNA-3-methyladenine glycosylase II